MAAEALQVYYVPLSQPSRSLVLIAKAANIPHTENVMDMAKGDHRKPEFKAINPFGTVPVLADGDFVIVESVASAKYLASNKGAADNWYPSDPKRRARVDEYLAWQHTGIRSASIKVAMSHVFTKRSTGKDVPEEEKQAALQKFDEKLGNIESYFLKDKPFIAGDEISIADIFAVSEIEQAVLSKTDYLKEHPKAKAWIERVKSKTNPHFDQVFRPLYEFAAKI